MDWFCWSNLRLKPWFFGIKLIGFPASVPWNKTTETSPNLSWKSTISEPPAKLNSSQWIDAYRHLPDLEAHEASEASPIQRYSTIHPSWQVYLSLTILKAPVFYGIIDLDPHYIL